MRKVMVVVALVAGCKKEELAPGAPASTKEQDALWDLAPDGAMFAIVASGRAVGMVERGWLDIRQLIATAPDLAVANTAIDAAMAAVGGGAPTLARLGLAGDKPGAMFVGKDEMVLVVPLGDRDKFLAAVHGTKGPATDTIEDALCKPV